LFTVASVPLGLAHSVGAPLPSATPMNWPERTTRIADPPLWSMMFTRAGSASGSNVHVEAALARAGVAAIAAPARAPAMARRVSVGAGFMVAPWPVAMDRRKAGDGLGASH
jgi:hypothetical protein